MKSVLLSFLLLPLAALCTQLSAQGAILSPEEAVRIALENNYDIRIAQGDADIAHLNNTKGNAGMLPNVNLVVNENFTLSAFQQKLANGNEFVSSGAPFNAANAGVQLAWTVFDGRRMFIAKNRLEQTDALGQLNMKNSVQTTAANILAAYYDITRSRMQEKALQEVIALNEERLRIAEARLAADRASEAIEDLSRAIAFDPNPNP
jgi:outer membrane protein TolC